MNLCDSRNKIIKSFEDKNIKPANYAYDAKAEPKEYDRVQESEEKSEESISEKT